MRKFLVSLTDLNEDRMQFRDWGTLLRDPDWRQRARFLDRLRALLERIPPVERDIIELHFFKGKTQEMIARLLGVTQQAVSHRMYTAFRRITFMLEQPDVSRDQMHADLTVMITNPTTVAVLCDFALTSSQTATARNVGLPQQRVNWHLMAGMKALQQQPTVDGFFYSLYFGALMEHKNILRDVARYHGRDRGPAAGRTTTDGRAGRAAVAC